MGVVYKAEDTRLGRLVALKFLPEHMAADSVALERFRREARSASSLNHPNICTIYDIDVYEGREFIVMEYLDGQTLAMYITGRRSVGDELVAKLGMPIAEALGAAHSKGVIHRDIKPGNIFVTQSGLVKILDFGVAKLVADANQSDSAPLTETNTVRGTLPYMSPEQLLGENLDTRSDIYALGVVLYEIATGRRLYSSSLHGRLVDEILNRPASPPSSINGRLSAKADDIILKCLAKDPEDRYQTAKEIAVDLRHLSAQANSGTISAAETAPPHTVKKSRLRWTGLAIGLLLMGTLLALNARGIRDRIFARNRIGPIRSIAVLPLVNLSGDASQDYYADGMTDELITALARNRSLRVVSRTSAMQYKGVNRPLRDIAQSLGVDGILEGSVARNRGRVHLNLQLIYGPTDTHMWADSYDRDFNEAYRLPEELSQTIVREAKAASSPAPPHRYISPEAHDDYMQGLYFWNGSDPDRSLEYYEKAIRLQPDYAAAWGGMAYSYAAQAVLDEIPAKNLASKMEEAARKAVAIDDSSPEAHNALAMWYLFFAWDVADADAESRRSLQLNPNLAETHRMRAWVFDAMHEPDESFRELKQAITLDPMQYITDLGEAYMARGQFDDAIAELLRRSETEQNNSFIHFDLLQTYWLKGMNQKAVEELEKIVRDDPAKISAVRRAYSRGGSPAVAQWMMDDFKADAVRKKYLSPFEMARHYAFLGDKPNTLKFLEASYDQRYPYLIMVQNEPMFDLVHSESGYQALIRRMGLPPAW